MLDVARIAKVFAIALACTAGMVGAIGAFVYLMFLAADLTHHEAGVFIPIVLMLFGLLYCVIWKMT